MLGQVASLKEKYNEWVSSPVDRKLRLFENPILEYLTITPWYLVPIIWIPVIIYFIYHGSIRYYELTNGEQRLKFAFLCFNYIVVLITFLFCICNLFSDSSFVVPVVSIILGVIIWTLIEYSLHRWVFHMEPSGKSKVAIIVHFTLHGLHHKVPFDSRRLVFPPFPAAILVFLGYKISSVIFPKSVLLLIVGGSVLGYVVYDMIHFYLHNGTPKEGTYMYYMKRYHNQHHFVHHNNGNSYYVFFIIYFFWQKRNIWYQNQVTPTLLIEVYLLYVIICVGGFHDRLT